MGTKDLTEAEKTAIAYAYFKLEEWQFLAVLVKDAASEPSDEKKLIYTLLSKFPAAVLQ